MRTVRFEKAPVIFTPGGCFPRGWLQLTFVAKCATKVDLQLILFP